MLHFEAELKLHLHSLSRSYLIVALSFAKFPFKQQLKERERQSLPSPIEIGAKKASLLVLPCLSESNLGRVLLPSFLLLSASFLALNREKAVIFDYKLKGEILRRACLIKVNILGLI